MYDMFYDFANRFDRGGFRSGHNQHQDSHQSTHASTAAPPRSHSGLAPPASKKAIRNLSIVQVTSDDLLEESNKECLICLDDQKIGSTACKLACGHLYHQACLTEWLQKSCTCPVCRYELETDDAEYETERRDRMLKRKMRFRLDELKIKKISQLRDIASILSVSLTGCIDKNDVIEKLLNSDMMEIIENSPAILKTIEEFQKLGVKELRNLLLSFGLSDRDALEKKELQSRLLHSGRIILTDAEPSLNEEDSSDYGRAARIVENKNPNVRAYDDYNNFGSCENGYSNSNHDDNNKSSGSSSSSDNNYNNNNHDSSSSNNGDSSGSDNNNTDGQTSIMTGTQETVLTPPPSSSPPDAHTQIITEDTIRAMSLSDLRKVSNDYNVSLVRCLDRDDVINKLLASGRVKMNNA